MLYEKFVNCFIWDNKSDGKHFSLFNFRAKWLKEPNPEAEDLFRMVADVFIYWSKSHVNALFLFVAKQIECPSL